MTRARFGVRLSLALAAAVATVGAAKLRDAAPLNLTPGSPADDFPLPPIPPEQVPTDQAAPVPNLSLSAPSQPGKQGPRLAPDFFSGRSFNNGQGYTQGSTIDSQQEQRQKPIPGINLKMPLQ